LREEDELLQYLSRLLTALLERIPAEDPAQADYKALTCIAAALFRYSILQVTWGTLVRMEWQLRSSVLHCSWRFGACKKNLVINAIVFQVFSKRISHYCGCRLQACTGTKI
jgi:hypothetical protein